MKFYIIIGILALIIICLIGYGVFNHYNDIKKSQTYVNDIDKLKKERDEALKQKIVSITIFKTLPDADKDKKYQSALNIITFDTDLLNKKDKQLIDQNKTILKEQKKFNINGFGSIGFSQQLEMRTSIGLTFNRIFANSFYFGGGCSFDQYYPYNNGFNKTLLGGSLLLQIGFAF